MTLNSITPAPTSEIRSFVKERTGQDVFECYQCGKCSAGCPVSYAMDHGPRRIMRLIQMGQEEDILSSSTIWLCVGCETCSSRCPANIDISRVMESLRWRAAESGVRPAEPDIAVFHRMFLGVAQQLGRVHELGLAASYNLASKQPFANLGLVPGMIKRGKIAFVPRRVKTTPEVKSIFQKARNLKEK